MFNIAIGIIKKKSLGINDAISLKYFNYTNPPEDVAAWREEE